MLLQQVIDIHAANAQELAHVLAPQPANTPADVQQRELVGPAIRAQAWRNARKDGS